MYFKLSAILQLSGPAKIPLDDYIKHANEVLFARGARGITKIVDAKLGRDRIELTITAEGLPRPHNALLQFRKYLNEQIGRKHKIGVRSIAGKEYLIKFKPEKKPKEKIAIPYATVKMAGDEIEIRMRDLDENFLTDNCADRVLNLVQEKIEKQYYAGKAEHWELMWQSPTHDLVWNKDPTEEMLKRDWIKRGPTKGKWYFGPQLAAIARTMEKIAVTEVIEKIGFKEIMMSQFVPFEVWLRTGHLEGMPFEIYYAAEPATRDAAQWETFMDTVKITKKVPIIELKKLLKDPAAGICYAQCPNMYWAFENKVVKEESLPILIWDRAAVSARYESGGRHGMERVDEFHRLEPVFVGTPEQCVEIREKLINCYKKVFNEILELTWRMAWVTPFYMQQAGLAGVEDTEKKIKGTIDFEAYLPYRGDIKTSEWVEFQNLSIVGDKYSKAFNISSPRAELWSGCSGIGLERWTVSFLAQKGLDPEKWPRGFRKYLDKLPAEFKFA